MSRRHSVNRPPTPDVRDDDDDDDDGRPKEPTLHQIVNIKLMESGEKERLMELVRERLVECGWKDEMRALCRAFVKKNGRDNVTVDDLVRAITPKGRGTLFQFFDKILREKKEKYPLFICKKEKYPL
ncbi:hypothetical protein ACS0TY_031328 [Phlomoides rotata]